MIDLLVESKICPSKRQAREDITNGAIYLNGERITDLNYIVDEAVKIESCYTIIRRGKKKYTVIQY